MSNRAASKPRRHNVSGTKSQRMQASRDRITSSTMSVEFMWTTNVPEEAIMQTIERGVVAVLASFYHRRVV
jgi:hypothetical protein